MKELVALRRTCGSIFVFGASPRLFWQQGIDAYPFEMGVLLTGGPEDEFRWPGAFVDATGIGFENLPPGSPRIRAFEDRWLFHLAGIVEYAAQPKQLPDWSFPPEQNDAI